MGRYFAWALGVGFGIALSATPAAAQTHVDIGIWTPNGGGRVVLGSPRVYVPPPVYVVRPRVLVVERDYYRPYRRPVRGWERGHGHRNARFARAYYDPYPGRVYRADVYGRPHYRDDRYRGGW